MCRPDGRHVLNNQGTDDYVLTNNAPTFPTLEAICNAFQMTLSQFFCEDGNLIELTDEEKELISRWKQLSAEQRKALLELMGVI